jgi:hypothetical protein
MAKYYLLMFCEDHGDEFNVPALNCFTEKEYKKWLETSSGKLNPKYEKEHKVWKEKSLAYQVFMKELNKRKLGDKYLDKYTTEERKWYEENKVAYPRDAPSKVQSYIRAHLGNSSDGFEDSYQMYHLFKEFIEAKIVKVTEVSKDFYDTFHKAGMARLSLCNIFDLDSIQEYSE